jgi:hypothetical protein
MTEIDLLKKQAKEELNEIELFLYYIKDNNLGCHITIKDLSIGLCNNSTIKNTLLYQKKEIIKFLNDEDIEWI